MNRRNLLKLAIPSIIAAPAVTAAKDKLDLHALEKQLYAIGCPPPAGRMFYFTEEYLQKMKEFLKDHPDFQ